MRGVAMPDAVGHEFVEAKAQKGRPFRDGNHELGIDERLAAGEAEQLNPGEEGLFQEANRNGDFQPVRPFDGHAAVRASEVALIRAGETEVVRPKGTYPCFDGATTISRVILHDCLAATRSPRSGVWSPSRAPLHRLRVAAKRTLRSDNLLPLPPVVRHQRFRIRRALAADGVRVRRHTLDRIQNWVHDLPGPFDFVAADEQARVALDRVEQEAFVGLGQGARLVGLSVVEGEVAGPEADAVDLGYFGLEVEGDPFVRLEHDLDPVAVEDFPRRQRKHQVRRASQLNDDFGVPVLQSLTAANVEGHILPPAVVDVEFDRGERRRLTRLRHARLVEVTRVLAYGHARFQFVAGRDADAIEHFEFFIP